VTDITQAALAFPDPRSPQLRLGIVGCGVMGRGIAQIAALSGTQVKLFDTRAGAAREAVAELRKTFDMLVARAKINADQAQAAVACVQACDDIAQLHDSQVVVEAVVENLAVKKALFAQLEDIVAEDAVLATNTSSLQVTSIAAGLRHPHRLGGFHFFNPVPLMKLVEVIAGLRSAPQVVDFLLALGSHWGHVAVRAKDTPGFIVNHAGRAYSTEGMRILSETVTDVATLDLVLRECAGFRLGPCELMDLTGVDVSHPAMESIFHQYYEDPRYKPQPLTQSMLNAGLLGRKTGQGFYRYGSDGKREEPTPPAHASRKPDSVWISNLRPDLAASLRSRLASSGVALESGERPSQQALIIVTPLGEDASSCVAEQDLDAARTVAVDALFHLGRMLVIRTPATRAHYVEMACGLFEGITPVSVVNDSAGLICQRVVALIVNVASEIAQQGIAAPEDIDRAVKLGLGYPHGPLAWGDLLGPANVLAMLANLERLNGDGRYRPSHWLRRRAALGMSLLEP
jgi:3-hydroxybutyryl-CoA dehydrogenase